MITAVGNDFSAHRDNREAREGSARTLVDGFENRSVLEREQRNLPGEARRSCVAARFLGSSLDLSHAVSTESDIWGVPPTDGSIGTERSEGGPSLQDRSATGCPTKCPLQAVDQTRQDIVGHVEERKGEVDASKSSLLVEQQDFRRSVGTAVVCREPALVQNNSRDSQKTQGAAEREHSKVQPLSNAYQGAVGGGGRLASPSCISSRSNETAETQRSDIQKARSTTVVCGGPPLSQTAVTQESEISGEARSAIRFSRFPMESDIRASDVSVIGSDDGLGFEQPANSTAESLRLAENLGDFGDDAVSSCKDLLSVVVDCVEVTDGSVSDAALSEPIKGDAAAAEHRGDSRAAAPRWAWSLTHLDADDASSDEHLPVTRSRLRWESRDVVGSKTRSLYRTMALVKPFLFAWAPTQRLDWQESDMSDTGEERAVQRRVTSQLRHAGRPRSKATGIPPKKPGSAHSGETLRKQSQTTLSNGGSISVEGCFGTKVQIRKRKADDTANRAGGGYAADHGKPANDGTAVTHMSLSLAAQLYPSQLLQFFVDRELRAAQAQESQSRAARDGLPQQGNTAGSRTWDRERPMRECCCSCQGRCGGALRRDGLEESLSSSASSSLSSSTDPRGQSCTWGCSCSPTRRHVPASSVYHNHYAGASFYLLVSDIKSTSPEALGTLLSTSAQPLHLGPNLTGCASSERR